MDKKEKIIKQTKEYIDNIKPKKFIPGETYITASGQTFDGDDVSAIVENALELWYAEGKHAHQFERDMVSRFKNTIRDVILCNSGSSADLLAITAITDPVFGERRAKPGDEIITVAAGFPTTINPIIQNGLVPVFVDVDLDTFLPNMEVIENAIVEGKTKAVILAHPLGNPFDASALRDICDEYNIFLIEDACFVANTLVPTKDGTKHISDIVVGDRVLGFDGVSFTEVNVIGTGNRLVPQDDVLCLSFGGQQVRCTKNHKFYVRGEWIRADHLKVGDEVYHSTWSEYVSWRRKDFVLSDAGRQTLSIKMKNNNPMFNPETVKKSSSSRLHQKLSHIEKRVMEVIKEYSLPITYTGDFSFWVGNDVYGYKNPDFFFEEKNIVFEVYDPTFLYEKGFRDGAWEDEKARHYAQFGYKTVFIPLHGWVSRAAKLEIANLLRSSISNGKKLTRISKVKLAHKLNLEKEPDGYIRVYDITCSPHHNFCLTGGILVHNCDGLGGSFAGSPIGSYGDLSTVSFYPAHQITAGEGGAVLVRSNPMLAKVVRSFRDWGRDCWCEPGKDNTCGKRFGWKHMGQLPDGYDHKYVYSRIGYNLKMTDLQASLLVSQLKKLDGFVERRKYNWNYLREHLNQYKKYFRFQVPLEGSEPSWFGFAITVKETAPFNRLELTSYLESKKIGTRLLFGGNILKQPAYKGVKHIIFQDLVNTDVIMRDTFWIGVYPGIHDEQLEYMVKTISEFVEERTR